MYKVEMRNEWGEPVSEILFETVHPFVEKMLSVDPDALVIIAFGNGARVVTSLED